MQKYQNNVTNRNGDAAPGLSIIVTTGGTVATIYSDNGLTPAANPLTTDINGYFEFYAPDGRYNISVADAGGYTDVLIADTLLIAGEASSSAAVALDAATAAATQAGLATTAKTDAQAARDEAVPAGATATAQAGVATTQAGISTTKAGESGISATASAVSASLADASAAAALAAGHTYTTTAQGITATTSGQMFLLKTADPQLYDVYTNVAGSATAGGQLSVASALSVKGSIIGVVGKNKFNLAVVTAGVALNDSGVTFSAAGRNVSEYIAVPPSAAYRCTGIGKMCWYDAAKAFVAVVASPAAVTSPSNAAFARLDVTSASLATAQMELGANATPYESFRYLSPAATVDRSSLRPREVLTDAIGAGAVMPWQQDDVYFLNMHDGSLVAGMSLSLTDGYTETVNAAIDHTNWISAAPSTQYTANEMSRVIFYRDDRSFISVSASLNFTTPSDCRWIRFNLNHSVAFRFQVNEGSAATAPFPQPYKYTPRKLYVPPATKAQLTATTGRLYNMCDAWYAWVNGDKFPVAFLGDSTTDGNGTTGYVARPTSPYLFGVDVVRTNSYSNVLQGLIREATGSSVARCYNAGFSGQRSTWALTNIDAILSGDLADTKMVFISHGINDRTASTALFASNFYRDIQGLIVAILAKGMQPVLMTTQPTTMPSFTGSASGPQIEEIANKIKRVLAEKWGLELVDINRFGRDYQTYSNTRLYNDSAIAQNGIYEAAGNTIHWADIGHKYEAGLIFAHICPRVLWTTQGEQLDFASQFVKSTVNWDQVTQLAVPDGSWKIQAKFAKAGATDALLQDFYLFNNYRGRLNLAAYAADAPESAYVKLNGVTTAMDAVSKAIGTLEMGLHHIEAWSGATTAVNWRGFKASI